MPKAAPRRNVQRPGLTRANAAPTPAQSSQPGPSTSALDPNVNAPEAAQPAPAALGRTGGSVQLDSNERRTQNGPAPDVQEGSSNGNAEQNSTRPFATRDSTSRQRGGASTHSTSAPASQAAVAQVHGLGQTQSGAKVTSPVSSRKRKAGGLEASRLEQANSRTLENTREHAGRSPVEQTIPTSHISPDIAIPSVETESSASIPAKSKRGAPKPRAQPRVKNAVQSNIENSELRTSATPTQQPRRSQSVRQDVSKAPSAGRSEADALLQNVTSQFSAVSRLADGIDGTSRASILARSGSNLTGSAHTTSSLANALNRAAYRQTQARTAADLAAEIISEAVGVDSETVPGKSKRKRRKRTPDDAEEQPIDPAETRMGDLTRSAGVGKKSGIEIALENVDWKAVKQQQKEMAEETARQAELDRQEKRSGKPKKRKKAAGEKPDEALVPQMTIVNGIIVSVAESREIDIRQDAEADAAREDANVITIDKLTMRKNQNTIGKPKGLQGKQLQWSEEMDERFYKGVRMFGADMLMVSSLFPKLERRHVKKKFVREERANPEKLREALFNPMKLDEEDIKRETGMELGDPRKLDEELREMEGEMRRRFEEDRAEAGVGQRHDPIEVDDADVPLPSTEVELESGVGLQRGAAAGRENRFNNVADDIINDALGGRSKKGKRKAGPRNPESASVAPRGRGKKDGSVATGPRKGTKAAKEAAALLQLGGTVEAIGVVDG